MPNSECMVRRNYVAFSAHFPALFPPPPLFPHLSLKRECAHGPLSLAHLSSEVDNLTIPPHLDPPIFFLYSPSRARVHTYLVS